MSKNKHAVALGRLGLGVRKTGLSAKEIKRRSELAKANLKKMNGK